MEPRRLVSIIITNYNYGRFLREAVDSALDQTHPKVEVIVVDDGSTDGSREIIAQYGERLVPMLKANGGMISALNAAFPLSRGAVICFLDADDALLPHAMETIVPLFNDPRVAEVDWPLRVIDESGAPTGKVVPRSGHAWSRVALAQLFPLPQEERRYGVDGYLWTIVPLLGRVQEMAEPLGFYRWHGQNWFAGRSLEARVRIGVEEFDFYHMALGEWCRKLGRDFNLEQCVRDSWFHRLNQSIQDIQAVTPEGSTLILVDEEQWGAGDRVAGRSLLPFMERDGKYWGVPGDDATAIRELERLRAAGAGFMIFVWSTFWWLEHFSGLRRHLADRYRRVLENDRLIVVDLRS